MKLADLDEYNRTTLNALVQLFLAQAATPATEEQVWPPENGEPSLVRHIQRPQPIPALQVPQILGLYAACRNSDATVNHLIAEEVERVTAPPATAEDADTTPDNTNASGPHVQLTWREADDGSGDTDRWCLTPLDGAPDPLIGPMVTDPTQVIGPVWRVTRRGVDMLDRLNPA